MRLLLFLSLLVVVSCGPSKEEIELREKQRADSAQKAQTAIMLENHSDPTSVLTPAPKSYNNNADFYIGIYNINGCEYVSFGQGHGCCAVVHAGNCINPVHTQTHIELKELLEEIKKNTKY